MSTAATPDDICPCIECSMAFGHPSQPIAWFDEPDPEDDQFSISCPGCSSAAHGPTPADATSAWNEQQSNVLAKARTFLRAWDELHPDEPSPGLAL